MARVIDLTQPLGPDTALWPGSPPFSADVIAEHARDGYYSRTFGLPEHSGTHLDAPAHFVPDGQRAHEIDAGRLVVECAVVDVAEEAGSDYGLTRERLELDESEHGRLPEGGAVLVRTGWDRHRADAQTYVGSMRFPGVEPDAAELIVERGCTGLGIDTLSVDPGRDKDFRVHHITLPAGLWQLEGLVNLDALPPRGATLFVGALRLVEGSGTPARVLALVP